VFALGGVGVLALVVALTGAILLQQFGADRQYRELLAAGERALRAGNPYVAIEAFSGALALQQGSMVAYYRRGEAYRTQHRVPEAIRDLRSAAQLAPEAPEPLIALGDLFADENQPAEAAAWYSQAADLLRDADPTLLYRLALAQYRAGRPQSAVAPLTRAIARNNAFAEAHLLLGLVHRDTRNVDLAVEALERAIALEPDLTSAREELADLYRAVGRPVDEMRHLQALAAGGDPTTRRIAIALAEAQGGQFDGALATLRAVQASLPNDSRVHLALGRVHLARAERTADRTSIQQALDAFEHALGGTARRSEGLALYGRALFLRGDFELSEQLLREAVSTSPVALPAFQYLADVAAALAHPIIARDALLSLDALEGDTAAPEGRMLRARRIGELSLEGGDYRTAVEHLSRVASAGEVTADTLGSLAHARWLSGDAAGAREALARALSLAPDDARLARLSRLMIR